MAHDFKRFPELANAQMEFYYFVSPHKQIVSDFRATVVKVVDGDTIWLECDFRDFRFPFRFINTNAPEINEPGGERSRKWLENIILGEEVEILINPKQRVGKWGRLLGAVIHNGMNVNEESIRAGMATPFDDRNEGQIPDFNQELWRAEKLWLA